jgi:hypothetical protein
MTDTEDTRRENVERIHLAQDKGQWRDLVSKVMNITTTSSEEPEKCH